MGLIKCKILFKFKTILVWGTKLIWLLNYSSAWEWVWSKGYQSEFGHIMDLYFHLHCLSGFSHCSFISISELLSLMGLATHSALLCIFKMNLTILFHLSGWIFHPPNLLFSLSFHLPHSCFSFLHFVSSRRTTQIKEKSSVCVDTNFIIYLFFL